MSGPTGLRLSPPPIPWAALVALLGSGVFGGPASLVQALPLAPSQAQGPSQIQPLNQPPYQAQSQPREETQATPLPALQGLTADRIPVGALLLSRPANARELKRVVEQEILPAIEEGRFSPEQARAFIRAQQKRLHLWNPNGTNEFNRLLWRRDIRG